MKELYDIDMEQEQYSKLIFSMGCDVGCPYIGRKFDDKCDEVFKSVIKEIEGKIIYLKEQVK